MQKPLEHATFLKFLADPAERYVRSEWARFRIKSDGAGGALGDRMEGGGIVLSAFEAGPDDAWPARMRKYSHAAEHGIEGCPQRQFRAHAICKSRELIGRNVTQESQGQVKVLWTNPGDACRH